MKASPFTRRAVATGLAAALIVSASCSPDENEDTIAGPPSMATTAVSAYDIVRVDSTRLTLDGNLSDWNGITAISIADDPGNGRGAANNSAKVKLAWNPTYLYVAYDVTDTELLAEQTSRDGANLYKDDAVEIFIDPQGDGDTASSMQPTDYQLLSNVLEVVGDSKGTGTGSKDISFNAGSLSAQVAAAGTLNGPGADTGYKLEMRVKWSDLGVAPSAGDFMRMDLAVDDRDGLAASTEFFDWANLGSNFNNPSGWKDVQLVAQGPAVVSAYDIVKVPTMNIDGKLSDWAGITAISMADDPNNGRGSLNNNAKVKLAWDPTYLYVSYDVEDTELLAEQTARDGAGLYRDDAVELYLDPQGDGAGTAHMTSTDYQLLANVLEAVADMNGDGTGGKSASWNAPSLFAQAVANGDVNGSGADTDYAIEMRVKWSEIGVTAGAGNFMRVDLAVDDRDGAAITAEYFDWANLGSNFNNPGGWKDVQLVVDATAPAAPTNLGLTVVSSSQIDVSWTASASSDAAKYKIYRGTTGTPALVATVSKSPYQDTNLSAGTTYTYQVSTVDAAGNESSKTQPATATTTPPPSTAPGGTIGQAPRNGPLWDISGNSHRLVLYQGGPGPTPGDNAGPGPNSFADRSRIEAGTDTRLTTWRNDSDGDRDQATYTITRIGTGHDMSWHGGYVKGSLAEDGSVPWWRDNTSNNFHGHTAFNWTKGKRGLIEHFSAYNKGDGLALGYATPEGRSNPAVMHGRDGLVIRYSALEGMGDDVIENDLKDSITVYQNYLSSVSILSTRPGAFNEATGSGDISENTDTHDKMMVFDGNLCWLRPKRFDDSTPKRVDNGAPVGHRAPGVFRFWKWQIVNPSYAMKISLKNNILRYDDTPQHHITGKAEWTGNIWGSLESHHIASSTNNVVLFPNRTSGFPGPGWPPTSMGFTYIYGDEAKARWNQAIDAWMSAHPEVKVTDPGRF